MWFQCCVPAAQSTSPYELLTPQAPHSQSLMSSILGVGCTAAVAGESTAATCRLEKSARHLECGTRKVGCQRQ